MTGELDTNDGAEVIELGVYRKRVTAEPLLTVEGRREACSCRGFRFDMKERAVWCKKCGREWGAFDALVAMAENWRPYAENLGYLRSEEQRLREEAEQLRKDIAKLKAGKRRADEIVTALLSGLTAMRRRVRKRVDELPRGERTWGNGVVAGIDQAIQFIESGEWRKDGSE